MTVNKSRASEPTQYSISGGVFRKKVVTPEYIKLWHLTNKEAVNTNFTQIIEIHEIEGHIEATWGMWQGISEPSFIFSLFGKLINVEGAAAEWGRCHNQKEMLLVYINESGDGFYSYIELDPPLSEDEMNTMIEGLESQVLSCTFWFNNSGLIKQVVYWGQKENNLEDIAVIALILEDILGKTVNIIQAKDNYIVDLMLEKDFPDYIDRSIKGRIIEKKSCRKAYKPPS